MVFALFSTRATCASVWIHVSLCFPTCEAAQQMQSAMAGPNDCHHPDAEGVGGHLTGSASFLVEKPRLWWPRGHGEQALYQVRMELCASRCDDSEGRLGSVSRRIGLRSVQVKPPLTLQMKGVL